LRIALEKNMKVVHALERLNSVIHRSGLTSRFVSLFYGELEPDGTLVYVNAGHPPPLIIGPNRVTTLEAGGSIIGPLEETHFRRGISRLDPGEALIMYTDGIAERFNAAGEMFGSSSVQKIVQENRSMTAQDVLDRLFAGAYEFGNNRPWEDDATAVVIVRK
jgi:sigma-B regulation protein RsbU (phosphoserine phosphatase)